MIQFQENAQTDGKMEGQMDRPYKGQKDGQKVG